MKLAKFISAFAGVMLGLLIVTAIVGLLSLAFGVALVR